MAGPRIAPGRLAAGVWCLMAVFVSVNSRWVWLYRHAQPLDIDEAGYLTLALVDYDHLARGGLAGWWHAAWAPGLQAPVTPAITALLFALTGTHAVAGFATPLAAGTGVVGITYALGTALASPRAGLIAAILTACCPVIVNGSRSFHFSMPVTLVTAMALLALVRSRRFSSLRWALAFGACLGLMPLTRTMTVAFLPGMVLAASLDVCADQAGRPRRLLHLALSLGVAAAIAATWLGESYPLVLGYLTGFGYGAHAAAYGASHSAFGPDGWIAVLRALCIGDVYLPHLLVMAATALGMAVLAARRWASLGSRRLAAAILGWHPLPLAVFATTALLALASSRNTGSAFYAPVVPPVLVLFGCLADRLARPGWAGAWPYAPIALVVLVAGLPLLDVRSAIAVPVFVGVPLLGSLPLSDGRGTLQRYEASGGMGSTGAAQPISQADGHAWLALDREVAERITELAGPEATLAFGFRHRMVNVNTINLDQVLRIRRQFGVRMVDPIESGSSVNGYAAWIERDCPMACALLTASGLEHGQFPPDVSLPAMEHAARLAGFTPVMRWITPEGWPITMWQRHAP